jgi:hypothetical protein
MSLTLQNQNKSNLLVKKDVLEQTQLLRGRTPFIPSLPTVTESLTLSLLWIWIFSKLEEEVDTFFSYSDRIPNPIPALDLDFS